MAQRRPDGLRKGLRALSQTHRPENLVPVLDNLLWFHFHNTARSDRYIPKLITRTFLFSPPHLSLIFNPVALSTLTQGVYLLVLAASFTDRHLNILFDNKPAEPSANLAIAQPRTSFQHPLIA